MNDKPEHREPVEISDEALDDLLSEARWPQTPPETTRRLTTQWWALRAESEEPGRGSVRRWYAAAAAAAALGMMIGGTALWWGAQETTPTSSCVVQSPRQPGQHEPGATASGAPGVTGGMPASARAANLRQMRETPTVTSRPPTLLERLRFQSAMHRREQRRRRARRLEREITATLVRLARDPRLSPLTAARPLLTISSPAQWEPRVIHRIRRLPPGRRRAAAVRLLSALGTRRSLPLLITMIDNPWTRGPAIRGVVRLADPHTLRQLIESRTRPDRRRRMLRAILEADPQRTLALFLEYVADPKTSALALAAAGAAENPPIHALIAALEAPRHSIRTAAARTLARVASPRVVRRLARMAIEDVSRRGALLALVVSRSPAARRFTMAAMGDPDLSAVVRSLRLRWAAERRQRL